VKQKLQYLETVLLPFHQDCHSPATQVQLHGLHSSHPLDVVHLKYQQY